MFPRGVWSIGAYVPPGRMVYCDRIDYNADMGITERQQALVHAISDFLAVHRYAPLERELAERFGCSVENIARRVRSLVKRGVLAREPGEPRTLRVVDCA